MILTWAIYCGMATIISLSQLGLGSSRGVPLVLLCSIFSLLIYYPFIIIISIFTVYVNSLIIFADASPIDALQTSFKLASKNVGMLAAIIVVSSLVVFLGLVACCIGIVFTMSFMYVMYYLVYKQTIGFETNTEDTSSSEISTSY